MHKEITNDKNRTEYYKAYYRTHKAERAEKAKARSRVYYAQNREAILARLKAKRDEQSSK